MDVGLVNSTAPNAAEPEIADKRLTRFLRPALGFIIPVGLALGWEIAVWAGLSDGRLMPTPSRIYEELAELARLGELQRHAGVTLLRVAILCKKASAPSQKLNDNETSSGQLAASRHASARGP
jgi:hypothetical protein